MLQLDGEFGNNIIQQTQLRPSIQDKISTKAELAFLDKKDNYLREDEGFKVVQRCENEVIVEI